MPKSEILMQRVAMPKPILTEIIKFNCEIINLVPVLQSKIKVLESALQQEQQKVTRYINNYNEQNQPRGTIYKKEINE